jgi:hypothetical protein
MSATVALVQTKHQDSFCFHGKSSSNMTAHKTKEDDKLLTLWHLMSGITTTEYDAQNTE